MQIARSRIAVVPHVNAYTPNEFMVIANVADGDAAKSNKAGVKWQGKG